MKVAVLCEGMLDALDSFDKSIPPLGLYSCDDLGGRSRSPQGYEWSRCLAPLLRSQNCTGVEKSFHDEQKTMFEVPEIGFTQFEIVRLSKIKVRKFGEHYQMDKHRNYAERWEDAGLETRLANLWNNADDVVALRLLLFIGFDKTPKPFGGKLFELANESELSAHQVRYFTRTWRDRYERNFCVQLSIWAHFAT